MQPKSQQIRFREACWLPDNNGLNNPVCINGVLFSYQNNGFLVMNKQDYLFNKDIVKGLSRYFDNEDGVSVAKVEYIHVFDEMEVAEGHRQGKVPCNVKWSNTHMFDVSRDHACLNFIASSGGDIFLIFAEIPNDYTTWLYMHISDEGVGFYKGMKLVYARPGPGVGSPGEPDMFESYFACISYTKEDNIILQYGKSEPPHEYGHVLASHLFPTHGERKRMRFYSFGAGDKEVNFANIHLLHDLKEDLRCDLHWVKIDGVCMRDCHPECKETGRCKKFRDSSQCYSCKNYVTINGTMRNCTKSCPPGFTVSESNKKECIPCERGSHKSIEGNSVCLLCHKGHASDTEGAKECKRCPRGHFADQLGMVKCEKCPKGSFSNKTGSRKCELCTWGKYSDEPGMIGCEDCPIGHHSPEKGQTKCEPCPAGHFTPTPGHRRCFPCDEG